MTEPSPETLGRYMIRAEIGRGGFATVYQALDTSLNREVALKVLHPQMSADRSFVERFRKEARTLASLRHPNIVTIYEVSEVEGRLFIAMELAHGPSLAQAIVDRKHFPWADALAVLKPVSEALDYAHGQGVVHRDLKPANVLLDAERGPQLTDFGFARLLGDSSASMSLSGGILGTPAYIAPEVWELDTATPAADIYALGCIAYEMLAGTVLFPGKTPMQSMRAHDHGPQFPTTWPEDVPPGVDAALQVALARKPENRYPKATTFWHALNDLEANAQASREQVERQAIANQWKVEVAAAMAASEWSAARMAVGRWLAATPDDPQALAARKEIEQQMQPEAERQQKEEAERAAQVALAAETARRAEDERTRQEAERKAKEEDERQAREEQERQRQAELAAQAAAAEKAKLDAEERERQKRAAETAALEKSKREAAENERQRQELEDIAPRPIAAGSQPEMKKPSKVKWILAAGLIIAILAIGLFIAAPKNPPVPTVLPPTEVSMGVAPTPTRPPADIPTQLPTDMPTEPPTVLPTEPLTVPPTELPTVPPTEPPTPTTAPNFGISAANVSQLQPLQRLTGVTELVRQVVFSPDSQWLAASSGNQSDFNVRVWQIPAGTLYKTLAAPTGIVWSVDFARDGTRIGATSEGNVYLWSFPDGELQKEVRVMNQAPSIAFAPDNERLAVGGTEGISLLHVADGSLIAKYSADRLNTTNLAFSPDGKILAEGATDRVARLVNVDDGQILRSLQLPHQGYSLTMSPDGSLVAIGLCFDSGTSGCTTGQVWVWRISDGEVLYKLDVSDGGMEGIAFSPDGELLAASGSGSILLWRMTDGQQVGTLSPPGGRPGSISFSPDGLYLASGEQDNGITLWGIQP